MAAKRKIVSRQAGRQMTISRADAQRLTIKENVAQVKKMGHTFGSDSRLIAAELRQRGL